jgi:protein pelota
LKVLKRVLKEGKVVLKIETLDDLWHLYNVVAPGDIVISRTMRRVRVGAEDSRKQESVRKPMTLKLAVEDVSFHNFSNRVRILGKILEGPKDLVDLGTHHTFNVETGTTLTIVKERWPSFLLNRLKEAEKSKATPLTLLVSIEDGVAELFLIADFGIREAVRVRATISRKRGDQKSHDKTMREFYGEVVQALKAQLDQHEIGLIIIAGPGFVKDHFRETLASAGIKNLPSVVVESTNTIGVPAAKEILGRGVIGKAIESVKLEVETQLIEKLIENLAKDNGLATYGDKEVERAVQFGAVEELLITDKKLREGDENQRRRMDRLIRNAEKTRSTFHIVSTDHPSGDQLQNLGGIAAILRFKMQQ